MKPLHALSDDELAALLRRAVALPDAPDALIESALKLWPAAPSPSLATTVRALGERILASLTFDSWASAPMAFGVRSVPSDTRQLLFSAQGRDVDLRLIPAGELFALRGQLLGPDESGEVELVAAGGAQGGAGVRQVAALDDLGEFRLDDLAPGTYTLTLRVPAAEIELPAIEIGQPRT